MRARTAALLLLLSCVALTPLAMYPFHGLRPVDLHHSLPKAGKLGAGLLHWRYFSSTSEHNNGTKKSVDTQPAGLEPLNMPTELTHDRPVELPAVREVHDIVPDSPRAAAGIRSVMQEGPSSAARALVQFPGLPAPPSHLGAPSNLASTTSSSKSFQHPILTTPRGMIPLELDRQDLGVSGNASYCNGSVTAYSETSDLRCLSYLTDFRNVASVRPMVSILSFARTVRPLCPTATD